MGGQLPRSNTAWKNEWRHRKQRNQQTSDVIITKHANYGGRLHVVVPSIFHKAFSEGAREIIGATWKPRTYVWSFPPQSTSAVFKLVRKVVGSSAKVRMIGLVDYIVDNAPRPEDCPF